MADISVALIGLGRLGASIGLALNRYNNRSDASNQFTITGTDVTGRAEQAAKEMGAVHDTVSSPVQAAAEKDLIVVSASYSEIRRIFREIAPELRDGAVVLDLSPLKQPSMQWAKEYFSDDAHLVGATAVVNPIYLWDGIDDTEHATVDYFDDGEFLLAPAPSAQRDAVELVTQLAGLLGANTHFVDPAEHDGVIAATEAIPALLGVGAFRAMASSHGWSEIQRTTNPAFGRLTHRIMDTHPDDIRDMVLNNKDNVVRHFDETLAVLQQLRDVVADGDVDAVEATLINAEETYQQWLRQRSQGKWDDYLESSESPSRMGGMLSGMLGGFLADRLTNSKEDDK